MSEYDSKRLLWLENMSRYLKHEMDNSILSIKMEVSNLNKQQSVHDSENLQSIEVEASQIDRLLSVAMKAKELEKALVPKDRKRVEVATYIETYLKNYVPSRADVRVLLE